MMWDALLNLERLVLETDPVSRRRLPRDREKGLVDSQRTLQLDRSAHVEHDRAGSRSPCGFRRATIPAPLSFKLMT